MDHDKRLLYPFPDAQRALGGISRTTTYSLANAGLIELVKIGRRSFITSASIDRYIERLCAEQVA